MTAATQIPAAQWDSGLIISFWVFGIAGVICLVMVIGGAVAAKVSDGGNTGFAAIGGGLVGLVVCALALTASWFPFKAQYNRYVPVAGTVQQISSRILGDGNNSVTQRFVITFRDGRQRACDDTRCSLVRAGDFVVELCERDFQLNTPAEGWNCNFISYRRP
jgi:apolipoprotein N-acyltransferase